MTPPCFETTLTIEKQTTATLPAEDRLRLACHLLIGLFPDGCDVNPCGQDTGFLMRMGATSRVMRSTESEWDLVRLPLEGAVVTAYSANRARKA